MFEVICVQKILLSHLFSVMIIVDKMPLFSTILKQNKLNKIGKKKKPPGDFETLKFSDLPFTFM